MIQPEERVRVLLVDDDPMILRAIRRLLKRHESFETLSAENGKAALDLLTEAPVDMVVADIEMPGMGGYELLTEVRRRFPHVVRAVLSSNTCEPGGIGLVHQYWTKPWQTRPMLDALERTARVVRAMQDPVWQGRVNAIETLPGAPPVVSRLMALIDDPHAAAADVADVIATEPAMSAKVLQLVNSSFFGTRLQTAGVEQAVIRLGVETIRNLAMAEALFSHFRSDAIDVGRVQRTSLVVGQVASQMVRDASDKQTAFAAGLLRGVGHLILGACVPDQVAALVGEARAGSRPLPDVQINRLGVTDADLGAYLLGIWGLPWAVVDAVARQYDATTTTPPEVGATDAVRIATGLVLGGREPGFEDHPIDVGWLAQLKLSAPVPELKSMVARLLSSEGPIRRLPRAIARWAVTLRAEASVLQGATRDVSLQGVFVAAQATITPGTPVLLTIELPDGQTLEVAGVVRWVGHSATHGCQGVGIELDRPEPRIGRYVASPPT